MSTGQLQSLQQSASQYAGMVTAFCDKLRLDFDLLQNLEENLILWNSFFRHSETERKMKSFKVGFI